MTGIATGPAGVGLVAVGRNGEHDGSHALAWRSADGATWTSVSAPSFTAGPILAVAPGGPGFVAVGESADQTRAVAWTSSDGLAWKQAPDAPSLDNNGLEQVMTAVAAAPHGGVVAVGWRSDAGNGSAVTWTSRDGSSWDRTSDQAVLSGAGMAAVLTEPRLIAVGTHGWPDTHAATVWLGP